jgi:hypothetical protein
MTTAHKPLTTEQALREPFEVCVLKLHDNEVALEVWQRPLLRGAVGKPERVRVGRIHGLALRAIWDELLLTLRRAGVYAGQLSPARRQRAIVLPEEVGVRAALLVAAVAPLRKLQRIEQVASAVVHMSYEEACYWYAHIRSDDGRRALRALRLLLAPE